MFRINRENHAKDFHGRDQNLNESFESAKSWFDSQEHESMTRKPLKTETVKKISLAFSHPKIFARQEDGQP